VLATICSTVIRTTCLVPSVPVRVSIAFWDPVYGTNDPGFEWPGDRSRDIAPFGATARPRAWLSPESGRGWSPPPVPPAAEVSAIKPHETTAERFRLPPAYQGSIATPGIWRSTGTARTRTCARL